MSKKKPGGSRKPAKKPELQGRTSRKHGTRDGKPRPPENRRKTGGRTLRNGLDPAIGKKTQFQPGQCPNPGGRPKKKPVTELYRAQLEKPVPDDPKHRTYGELLVESLFGAGIRGNLRAVVEITDRLEGKATQPVQLTGNEGGAPNFKLNVRFRDGLADAREMLLAKRPPAVSGGEISRS